MFSEEFQCAYLEEVHKVLDSLDFVAGEHVWNFADFATAEGLKRVGGNNKGVFTRQRQPKMAAHALRRRWIKDH
jgi:beta-glucuronidase